MKSSSPSFFTEHPWMTFFLAGAVINGIVTIAGGQPSLQIRLHHSPPLDGGPQLTPERGTYR
jgi:hypothetical protein